MIGLGVFAVLALVVAVIGVLLGRPEHADLAPPEDRAGRAATADDQAAAAAALVERMEQTLGRADVDAAEKLGGSPAGSRLLGQLAGNVGRLDISGLRMRFVDTTSTSPPATYGSGAWTADVQLTWQLKGRDRRPTTVDVPLVLGSSGGRAVFLGVDVDPDYRVPTWLTGSVQAAGSTRTFAIAPTRAAARRLDAQAQVAVRTVNRTLPSWRGQLVVEAPSTQTAFEAASGLPEAQARGIAAVTTSTEPSGSPHPSVHVYLNPDVFDPLGPRGQQIVVSHEATHVAVGAANTDLPLWLSEGFADYVALRFSPLPETVLGSQITALVRKSGPPRHLPGQAEFAGNNPDVGAWYEGAWIAVDLLAQDYGTNRLLRFYREAEHTDVGRAFRTVLGTSEKKFGRAWAAHLESLAS